MALTPHLTLGARWTFIGGKGGVGKTTVAAALAVELAEGGEDVTILSTDPAHSLGDALGVELTGEPRPLPGIPRLRAFELDPAKEQSDFLENGGDAIAALIERGSYLDSDDVRSVTDLAFPGIDELAAVLRLGRLTQETDGRVIVDTAPTGHTLRLLDLPETALGWLRSLEAMQVNADAVAAAFTRGPREVDDEARFLAALRADLESFLRALRDPVETRFVLVANPEAAVLAETDRYRQELSRRAIAIGGLVMNRLPDDESSASGAKPDPAAWHIVVRRQELPEQPLEALRHFAVAAMPGMASGLSRGEVAKPAESHGSRRSRVMVGATFHPPDDRRLYFAGGKGGVGKTTVAAAMASRLARVRAGPVLLLSIDPAGSLSEILDEPVGPEAQPTQAFPGLHAQQLDATSSWSGFVNRYRDELETFLDGITGAGASSTLDRGAIGQITDLSPPGIDEVVAVAEVIDLLEDGRYDAVVVDTAPTGHFLRFLEMPAIAQEWSHAMLRLLLKYRSVVRLEGAGERILELSRSFRGLRRRLADPSYTWFGVVALPESLSIPESERLLRSMKKLGVEPSAIVVNRLLDESRAVGAASEGLVRALLAIDPALPAAATPIMMPAPSGPAALEGFVAEWRTITVGRSSAPG